MELNEDPPNAISIVDAQERSHSEIDVPALSQQVCPQTWTSNLNLVNGLGRM